MRQGMEQNKSQARLLRMIKQQEGFLPVVIMITQK